MGSNRGSAVQKQYIFIAYCSPLLKCIREVRTLPSMVDIEPCALQATASLPATFGRLSQINSNFFYPPTSTKRLVLCEEGGVQIPTGAEKLI
ncbi:MAG: hypothetical protein CXZ00_15370 [Acidobacteria bacterium]|nr:MAG: hypothetical protein CXZ00_15370 [Acidobacteriota bacterium]